MPPTLPSLRLQIAGLGGIGALALADCGIMHSMIEQFV